MLDKLINHLLGRRDPVATSKVQGAVSGVILAKETDALDEFLRSVSGLGHAQYPVLDATYSPNSRVPCTDLTPFIVDRLRHGDRSSIIKLLRLVLQANPGLGVGPGWIDPIVSELAEKPFDKYVEFADRKGMLELRALFMVAAKEGGGREFAISGPLPRQFAQALACQLPNWHSEVEELIERANRFIRKMRRDTPFWREFPLFKPAQPPALTDSAFARCLRNLSVAARLQVLFIVSVGPTPLRRASDYDMRNMGMHPLVTSRELSQTDLLVEVPGEQSFASLWRKDELLEALETKGVPHRKGWKKDKLLDVLKTECPDLVKERLSRDPVYALNPQYAQAAAMLTHYGVETAPLMGLLCFA